MNETGKRGSSLFLMELILAIFFFMISAAVCVRFYAKAQSTSETTKALSIGTGYMEGMASALCSDAVNPQAALLSVSPGITQGDNTASVCYDRNWNVCQSSDAAYMISVSWTTHDNMLDAQIRLTRVSNQEELHSLRVEKHIPYEGGAS